MKTRVFVAVFVVLLFFCFPTVSCSGEIDASTIAVQVISGDTFETQTEGLIKLADIDPACADIDNSTGYFSAITVLASLVENKTVYLDLDSKYVTDQTGTGNRTVAVVYVDYNSTHYQNVNFVMLNQKLLAVNDQDNDFSPENWTSFVKKQDIPEFSTEAIAIVFLIALIMAVTFHRRVNSKSN
jgi:micrococcal nuclease